jgi:hypothetical protein
MNAVVQRGRVVAINCGLRSETLCTLRNAQHLIRKVPWSEVSGLDGTLQEKEVCTVSPYCK